MESRTAAHIGFLAERMLRGFGVDLVIDRTARELVKSGFKVTVFCINSDGTFDNDLYNIVQIKSSLHHNPLKTEFSAAKALKRLNTEEDIDVWIAETYPFFLATKIMSKPVIVVDHGVVLTKGLHPLRRVVFAYIKFIQENIYFSCAAKIVNISKFTRNLTPASLRNRQEVIYNGADNYKRPSDLEISEFRRENGFNHDDVVLLYVGRINSKNQPYKGTDELVATFQELKKRHNGNVKLVMAGFGSESDKIWLEKNGIIPFISVDNNTLSLLYGSADCYVTASKWEGFDLPLVEAAYFGVPYVAYDAGAHAEVVNEKFGFLVKNQHEFLLKLEEIISKKDLRMSLSAAAAESASYFSWKSAGEKYKNTINEILDRAATQERKYDRGVVDVITLNYNGKEYLDNLFQSLKKQTYEKIRVTMVDNGSNDDSVNYVREKFPWVNVIQSKTNLFFSRGNNLAISQTKGEYLFLVNNDIVVDSDAIKNMVATIEEKGKYNIASVAAKMLFFKDKQVFDSAGVVITGNGSPFNRGIGQIDIGQYDRVEETFGACFGAVLIRRNVYEKSVGPLDNSYFGYFEDVDWSFRARIFGYKSYFCPTAVVYHDHSGTSKKMGYEWKYYLIHRNFIKTIIKNFQFLRMIRKCGWKILELINHLRKTKDGERRSSILRILWNTMYMMPSLLLKRVKIQTLRCSSDFECVRFSEGERSFFDAVNYSPVLTLDTFQAMFARLDMIKNFRDRKISDIVSKIAYLNERKTMMIGSDWDKQTDRLIQSLEVYIGADYTRKFIKAIVEKKDWKK